MRNFAKIIQPQDALQSFLKAIKKEEGFGWLDLALAVIALLMILTEAKVFYFHMIFVILTFGAFYWTFYHFVTRGVFWVTITSFVVLITVLDGKTQIEELIEIPLLTLILTLVFAVARQRAKAETALRQINEELEKRVSERTAELTRVNSELLFEINNHQQTEKTRQKLASVVEQTADIVIITNKDGLIEYVNPAFESETGYTQQLVIGRTPRILKSNRHSPKFYETMWAIILSGQVFRDVLINRKKGGTLYYEEKTISPIRDSLGEITHFVSTGKDITQRVQAQEALRESEERYRRLVELSFESIIIYSYGKIVHLNAAAAKLLGAARPEDIIGKPMFDFIHSDYWDLVQKRIQQMEQKGQGVPLIEEKLIRVDGSGATVEVAAVPVTYEGQPAIQAVIRDISARKQAEAERERLLATEREQRLLAETLGEVFLALTAHTSHKGVLDEILKQARRLVSYSAANIGLLKDNTLHIAHHQGYEHAAETIQPLAEFPLDAEIIKTRQPLVIPDTQQNPHWVTVPEVAWVRSFIAVPICLRVHVLGLLRLDSDSPGKFSVADIACLQPLANAAAIALDNARLYDQARQELLERIQIEQELRQIAAKNQAILDAIPDSIFHFSRNGQLLDHRIRNDTSAPGIFGKVVIGQYLNQMLPPDMVELMLQQIGWVLDTGKMGVFEYQLSIGRKVRTFETRLVVSSHNEVLAIISDVTERKARAAAVERERARIARDLHDSLGQSLCYLHLKLDEFVLKGVGQQMGPKIERELKQTRDVSNEAYEMVRSMLAAARLHDSIDLGTALLADAKSVGNQARFKVKLATEGQPQVLSPFVQQQIRYIFREALSNVKKHADANRVDIKIMWTPEMLVTTAIDDGRGFKTDEPRLEGHFGLSIMEERAEEINGFLSVSSNPDAGTAVTLQLPLTFMAQTVIIPDLDVDSDL